MDLRTEIENRTKQEIEKLISRAQRVKQREIESALVRKQEMFDAQKAKIDKETEEKIRRAKANLELEYKIKLLKFKDELINQLLEEIRQELHNLARDERYLSFLKKIVKEAETQFEDGEEMIIFLNSNDLDTYGQELIKELQGREVKLEVEGISGGIIIKSGNRNFKIDASLDNLLSSLEEDIREKIIQELQNV
jgi:vacuolar-type H+-ATPase subunit E/Vma4